MTARVSLETPFPGAFAAHDAERESTEWPPPPHDPRERELAMMLDGWEVRVFGGRMFQYFVTRGFWHLQLWTPEANISILTPSRLTRGFYEAFPVARWKAREPTYERIVSVLRQRHATSFPTGPQLLRLEKALVDDIVQAKSRAVS